MSGRTRDAEYALTRTLHHAAGRGYAFAFGAVVVHSRIA